VLNLLRIFLLDSMHDLDFIENNSQSTHARFSFVRVLFGCICILAFLFWYIPSLNNPDKSFPSNTDITIAEGLSESDILKSLEEKHLIRSSLYTLFLKKHTYENAFIQAGTYQFTEPQTTETVLQAITQGTNQAPLLKITLPEGFQARDLPTLLPKNIIADIPVSTLEQYEGYLFPDTYFISTGTTFNEIIALLTKTFDEKLAPYEEQIRKSGFSREAVIILASILEREAKDATSKRMVSGILQNRLRITMPLQVDAVFDYILNKTSNELTDDDLKMDSPYNTYTLTGLPPTPISNPGIESIEAVLNPTPSKYLYYLTASDGTFYYAKTFEEHKQNKFMYLR
jgi:UPF0755 protein